jgi:hypothetical protein
MQQRDTTLNIGGLMRCCVQTLRNYIGDHADDEAVEGLVLDCAHESPGNKNLVLRDGCWRWNGGR